MIKTLKTSVLGEKTMSDSEHSLWTESNILFETTSYSPFRLDAEHGAPGHTFTLILGAHGMNALLTTTDTSRKED